MSRTSLDFETDVDTGAPVVLTYHPPGEPIQVAFGRERMAEVSSRLIRDGFAAHNASFDADCIAQLVGPAPVWEAYDAGRIVCTMVGAVLREVRTEGETNKRGYALDAVCERFAVACAPDKSNPWRMRYGELARQPIGTWPVDAVTYLRDDVVAVDLITPLIEREADLDRQCAHEWWLAPPGRRGVRTDPAMVAVLGERIRRERDNAQSLCGPLFRPDGSRNMKAVAAAGEAAGITQRTAPSAKFPNGQLQVTAETIEDVDDPILNAYARYLSLDAHASRLLPQLERERLICRYRLASTGRAVASGTKARDVAGKQIVIGTNVQNLPKVGGWRECLIPDEDDHVFVVSDATGLELATFAEILDVTIGGSALAAALREGLDGHVTMGARLAGCERDAFAAALRGDFGPEARAYAKDMRSTAKGPNFGFPGGLGPGGFVAYMRSHGVRISLAEATRLRAIWLASDPTYAVYLERAGMRSRMGDPIIGLRCGAVRNSSRYTEHANDPFQRLGAMIAKASGYAICREIALGTGPLAGCRYALFAHDEHVISAPRSRAAEVAAQVSAIWHDVGARYLHRVPLHAETVIVSRWHKQASPRYDAAGVLTESPVEIVYH